MTTVWVATTRHHHTRNLCGEYHRYFPKNIQRERRVGIKNSLKQLHAFRQPEGNDSSKQYAVKLLQMPKCDPLFYPLWSHWWSLQSDWLSTMWFIHKSLFFPLNHICSKSHHFCPKLHHFCFKLHHFCSITISHHFWFGYKMRWKAFLFPLFNKLATWSIKYLYWLNFVISKWL